MLNTSTLQKGLIFHAPLDGEHQAKDVTPYRHNMTAYGGVSVGTATGRKGESNGSTEFDSNSNYLEGSFDYSGSTWSISAWVFSNDNASSPTQGVFGWTDADGYRRELYLSNNNALRVFVYGYYKTSATVSANYFYNGWHHIAVTVDGSIPTFYIDGKSIGGTVSSVGYTSTQTANQSRVGVILLDPAKPSSYGIDGKITDVRAYNRELSDDEIKLLYDSFQPKFSTTSLHKGLVLDVDMNDVEDRSPNAYDFTMVGNTSATPDRKGINRAKAFDGNDAYYNTNFKDSYLTDFTYTIWAKYTGNNSSVYRYFCACGSGTTGHQAGFGIRNNKIFISAYTSPIVYGTDLIDDVNDWHLYTMVYSDGTASIYIDDNLYEDLTINLDVQGSNFVIGGLADLKVIFLEIYLLLKSIIDNLVLTK